MEYSQSAFQIFFRLYRFAFIACHNAKPPNTNGDIGMVGTEDGFVDLQGAFEGGFRPGMIPQGLQHTAQIVDTRCNLRMLRAE